MTEEERQKLLDTPAYGEGSEEGVVTKPEGEVTEEEAPAESVEESKVPYSRFKKFHDEATQLRTEVEELRRQVTSYQPRQEEPEVEVPERWIRLYGDSDASKEAWREQQRLNEETITRAREEAIEAVRAEKYQEAERIENNIATIDEEFELLSDYLGRTITEKEQEAILDIVDDYTPKDQEGNYAGAIMPLEKAYEIYELKQQASTAPKKIARDSVASLSGSQSQGQSDAKAEQDKSFNPFDWDAAKKRL